MGVTILNYANAILFAFSVVVIFDLFLTIKRNKFLKLILVSYCTLVLWYSAANIYCSYCGYNRFLLETPFPLLTICSILLLSTLYNHKISNFILGLSIIIFLIYLSVFIYLNYSTSTPIFLSFSDLKTIGNLIIGIKLTILLTVLFILVFLYTQINKKYRADNIYYKAVRNWSIIIVFACFMFFISGITKVIIGYENIVSKYLITLVLLGTIISFLFRPKFLNKLAIDVALGKLFNKEIDVVLSEPIFVEAFYTKLYFKNQEASIIHFSKILGIPPDKVYHFIYINYHSNFTDLVNQSRVSYFIDMASSGKYDHFTIDALAQLTGFSSRHHLYKPFKKFHGGVPSDFLKSLGR